MGKRIMALICGATVCAGTIFSGGVTQLTQTFGVEITEELNVEGYQISIAAGGIRTVYSVAESIDGSRVRERGLIYGIADCVNEDDIDIDHQGEYVKAFAATSKGLITSEDGKGTYTMTMTYGAMNVPAFTQEYIVRPYAKLRNGTYYYGEAKRFSIFDVASVLYDDSRMPIQVEHDYLYNTILSVVDSNYPRVTFNHAVETETTQAPTTQTPTTQAPTSAPSGNGPIEVFGEVFSSNANNTITVVWGQNNDQIANGQKYNVYVDGVKKLSEVQCGSYDIHNISNGTHTVKVTAVLNRIESSGVSGQVTVAGGQSTTEKPTDKPTETQTEKTTEAPTEPPTTQPQNGTIESGNLMKIAFAIVSSAENSSLNFREQYSYIENIGDGRGYTGGIIGFTSGTGDMLEVVEQYIALKPNNNPLSPYLSALRAVNGTDSEAGLGRNFVRAWQTAANDQEMIDAQNKIVREWYLHPAVADAQVDGLSILGQFIYYDAMVMHGPGNDSESFGGIRKAALRTATSPAKGGDEATYLKAFIEARKKIMLMEEAHEDLSRLNAQLKFINEGNFDMNLPLSWTMYGDSFTLTQSILDRL